MQKISAMPAAQNDQSSRPTTLRLVESEEKKVAQKKQSAPKKAPAPKLSADEFDDMWDNMPV